MPLPKDPQALEPAGEHFGPSLSPHNEWINQGLRQGMPLGPSPFGPPAARDGVLKAGRPNYPSLPSLQPRDESQ